MSVHKHGTTGPGCAGTCCLKATDLGVSFGGEEVLRDVSFHLHCGEIVALIGPNGAGKSSLFRTILGQVPHTGTIEFQRAGGDKTRPLIGYVPQSPSFDRGDPVSVFDFFSAAISRYPVFLPSPRSLRARVGACLARVHGESLLDRRMGALSGGELQRVLLALALEPLPHILVLDEPLSGVDIDGEKQLLDMLDEIRTRYDLSILLSTHDFATLGQFADKVILLKGTVLRLLEPFHWQFMRNALLAVLVISPLFGLLSTMVVTSRMSFFSDALGHSAFTGIAIGTLCGLADPLWMAVLLAAVFALLFTYVRRKSNMASDTVIGVFSSTAVALGIFIATFGGGSFTQYNSLLIGDILSVEPAKIALLAVILLVVVLLWLCSFNQLMLSSIHPALADSRGVGVFWQEAVFSAAIAVVVTVSMTWVGLLVINSLLVLPAAAARNVARNMRQYHLFSLLGAVISGLAGLMTSYYIGSSAGASITLYLAVWFAVTFLLRKKCI